MNTELHREPAQIIAFPSRAQLSARRFAREAKAIEDGRLPVTACGSAWYHEAALQDDEERRPS